MANVIVNSYSENAECEIDTTMMPPEVIRFMMQTMQNVDHWYAGITSEIEAAHSFFLETSD